MDVVILRNWQDEGNVGDLRIEHQVTVMRDMGSSARRATASTVSLLLSKYAENEIKVRKDVSVLCCRPRANSSLGTCISPSRQG